MVKFLYVILRNFRTTRTSRSIDLSAENRVLNIRTLSTFDSYFFPFRKMKYNTVENIKYSSIE